jgi:hypothetical protein
MSAVLSRSEVRRLEYPRETLLEMITDLDGFPKNGYDFSLFKSIPPYARSTFSAELSNMPRQDAIAFFARTRDEVAALELRRAWSKQLFEQTLSCAVGGTYSRSLDASTVGGNVTQIQIIHARPADD